MQLQSIEVSRRLLEKKHIVFVFITMIIYIYVYIYIIYICVLIR